MQEISIIPHMIYILIYQLSLSSFLSSIVKDLLISFLLFSYSLILLEPLNLFIDFTMDSFTLFRFVAAGLTNRR